MAKRSSTGSSRDEAIVQTFRTSFWLLLELRTSAFCATERKSLVRRGKIFSLKEQILLSGASWPVSVGQLLLDKNDLTGIESCVLKIQKKINAYTSQKTAGQPIRRGEWFS